MDYNKLKTFLKVAKLGSVTGAARELARTQSAITQQLRLLEDELGMALFERKHARIFLTREGERLLAQGSAALGSLDDEVMRLKNDLAAAEGSLAIGVLEDFGTEWLCPLLGPFLAKHPKIRVTVRNGTSPWIEERLLANDLDIGFLVNFTQRELFEAIEIASEEQVLVAAPSYVKRRGPFASADDVIEGDLLDFTDDFLCVGAWVKKNRPGALPRLLRKKPALCLPNHLGLRSVVASGFGIALLPKRMAGKELGQLLPHSKSVRVGLDLALRKKRSPRLVERLFVDYMKSTLD